MYTYTLYTHIYIIYIYISFFVKLINTNIIMLKTLLANIAYVLTNEYVFQLVSSSVCVGLACCVAFPRRSIKYATMWPGGKYDSVIVGGGGAQLYVNVLWQ